MMSQKDRNSLNEVINGFNFLERRVSALETIIEGLGQTKKAAPVAKSTGTQGGTSPSAPTPVATKPEAKKSVAKKSAKKK